MNTKNVTALISRELSEFTCSRSLTMNSQFSMPQEAAECGIEISRSLFSELVQVNPDNSLAECVNLYLYNNQINARALIGQSTMVYCASKLGKIERLLNY